VVPRRQDGNYTNTLAQPVHPARLNILSFHSITGYKVVFFMVFTQDIKALFRSVREM
jgi:hypothetical protein